MSTEKPDPQDYYANFTQGQPYVPIGEREN